jgi:hypothetical protein
VSSSASGLGQLVDSFERGNEILKLRGAELYVFQFAVQKY